MPATLTPTQVDPRGPRFGAAVTTVVLAAVLILGPGLGLPLLIIQTFAFGAGSLLGLRYQPYGWVFRRLVRPRLGAPAELEDERPPGCSSPPSPSSVPSPGRRSCSTSRPGSP